MNCENDLEEYIDETAKAYRELFRKELDSDENKDYRRGFLAGILCAHLEIKSQFHKIKNQKY